MRKEFWVEGIPKPMPRIRAFNAGQHAKVYTPDGDWKQWAMRVFMCCGGAPKPAFEGPVRLTMTFMMPQPKTLAKSKRGTAHKSRPDIDNLTKLVMDRLQERGWFRDDGQVCNLQATKQYSDRPGLKLEILTDDLTDEAHSEDCAIGVNVRHGCSCAR